MKTIKNQISVALLTIIALIILVMLFYTEVRIMERNTPLIDASMEVKFEISLFHLFLEELLQGDPSLTKSKVWQHIEQSKWYVNAMLNGGKNKKGDFTALEKPQLRQLTTSSLAAIKTLEEFAMQRLKNITDSQAGSVLDTKFDRQFKLALNLIGEVETALHKHIQSELINYRILSLALAIIVICIGLIAYYFLYRYDKNRQLLITQLSDYNKNLESQVDERTHDLNLALEKAENASAAKSKFLSSMSHELRTPLNAILGFSQLIDLDTKEEKTKTNTKEIISGGNHLLKLINEVLDLSKIESGTIDLSIKSYSFNDIIKETLALIQPTTDKHAIQIDNKISPLANINIDVDFTRYKQVLLNIISNAIKYNSENGKVTIDYSLEDNKMFCLSVKDTGKGLTPEQQESIFTPFERAQNEYSNIEGTGIGLSISKNLAEKMGCKITVESQVGDGSCFYIYTPLT